MTALPQDQEPRNGLRSVVHSCEFTTASQFEVITGGFNVTEVGDRIETVEVDFKFESDLRPFPPILLYSMKIDRAESVWNYSFNAWYRERQENEVITFTCTLWYKDGIDEESALYGCPRLRGL